jgi:hypothetical protein
MIHVVAVALTVARVGLNIYLWHSVRSHEAMLAASLALALLHALPFWLYVSRR